MLKGNQQRFPDASFSSATEQRGMSRHNKSFQLLLLLSQGQFPFNQFLLPVCDFPRGCLALRSVGVFSAGRFAVMCDSGALIACSQCILQIHCKKSGDIRNPQSSDTCCLFHWAQSFQEKYCQALHQTALLLEEAGCCFTQSCVSELKLGDREHGQISL